jgi:heme oxygenase
MSLRTMLRSQTADDHAAVDAVFGRFRLDNPAEYRAFLSAHARAVPAIELALEEGGIERLIPDWNERRRRERLADDLEKLAQPVPPPIVVAPISGDAALWGAAYVLEGSKLGGAMLAKQVPEHLPVSYLGHQGPKGAMKAFMEQLDAAEGLDHERTAASARAVFDHFRHAAALEVELLVT